MVSADHTTASSDTTAIEQMLMSEELESAKANARRAKRQRQKSKKQLPDQQQQTQQDLVDQQPNDQQQTLQPVVEQQQREQSHEPQEAKELQALRCDPLQTQAAQPQQAGLLLQAQSHFQTETQQLHQQQPCEQQSSPATDLTGAEGDESRQAVQSDGASSDALALTVNQGTTDDSEHAHTQSQATVPSSNDLFLQDLFCCPLTKVNIAMLIPVCLVLTPIHV